MIVAIVGPISVDLLQPSVVGPSIASPPVFEFLGNLLGHHHLKQRETYESERVPIHGQTHRIVSQHLLGIRGETAAVDRGETRLQPLCIVHWLAGG